MKTKSATKPGKQQPRVYPFTGKRLAHLARTFDVRRSNATMIPLLPEAWPVQEELEREFPAMKNDKRGGILGKLDALNAMKGSAYIKYRLRYWTRRQLYNRLKWLKGELTRIITRAKTFKTEDARLAALLKRRTQIEKYQFALVYYKPLHGAVRKARKAKRRTESRRRAKKVLRKSEIQLALQASRLSSRSLHA